MYRALCGVVIMQISWRPPAVSEPSYVIGAGILGDVRLYCSGENAR